MYNRAMARFNRNNVAIENQKRETLNQKRRQPQKPENQKRSLP